ncbi:MAG: hypothetical protein K9I85_09360 [Saprospiraceae bacterium]|nr:hypothetical protein [Saprospiraceae bacterium]
MFSSIHFAFLFCFALFIPVVSGQTTVLVGDEREVMIRDVLAVYPDEFQSIEITTVKRLDDQLVELDYLSEGSEWEVILQTNDVDPVLVETAREISPDRWPDLIVDAWKKQTSDTRKIARIMHVSTPYGKQGYRVDSFPDSLEKGQIKSQYFDLYGQPTKPLY